MTLPSLWLKAVTHDGMTGRPGVTDPTVYVNYGHLNMRACEYGAGI
jgi:hypothetical protein